MDESAFRITPALHVIGVISNGTVTLLTFAQLHLSIIAQLTILFQ
jgi:hypothetical protein